jgi:alanine dehydrogenase
MLVGVPREIKDNEYRVGIVPSTVHELADKGHQVVIETQAGAGAGFLDGDYQSAGAQIVPNGDAVFGRAELIVKVKEPLAAERKKLSRGQVLFTYLHLAPDRAQTEELMARGVTAIAYETVTSQQGTLPLLMPMSEIAGRMAPQVGARYLEKPNGGRGVLLAGAPGVAAATVVVLGGGVAGTNAAQVASGLGADVTVLDRNPAYGRASANEPAVTREDFSSPVGAFLTQIPKLDSKKFYKRVPPKLFSIYSCGVFLIYSCSIYSCSAEWRHSRGLLL